MNYIGSKNKLSGFIISTIKNTVGTLEDKTFAELFAGTSIISHTLKNQVKKIITNDLEYYSYVLSKNYIGNNSHIDYFSLFDFLENNDINKDRGFIFNEYSENGIAGRLYFSEFNGKKIDKIRQNIKHLWENNKISEDLYFFCLASLLEQDGNDLIKKINDDILYLAPYNARQHGANYHLLKREYQRFKADNNLPI